MDANADADAHFQLQNSKTRIGPLYNQQGAETKDEKKKASSPKGMWTDDTFRFNLILTPEIRSFFQVFLLHIFFLSLCCEMIIPNSD